MSAVPLQRTHLDLGLETARHLLDRLTPDDALPIPIDPLRRLLPHGLLRGELIELYGERSSGRFSIVLALLAAATIAGETAALVDLGDHFDPQDAKAAGVVLERLLWMRPGDLKQTLHAAETAITGGFPLVACDLGAPPIRGGRGAQSSWLRLLAAARSHRSALLVSTPYRASGSAATIVLEARRGSARWRGERPPQRLLEGVASRLALKKMRGGIPETSADLLLRRGDLAPSLATAPTTTPRTPTPRAHARHGA
jgi:recombination protein RecA